MSTRLPIRHDRVKCIHWYVYCCLRASVGLIRLNTFTFFKSFHSWCNQLTYSIFLYETQTRDTKSFVSAILFIQRRTPTGDIYRRNSPIRAMFELDEYYPFVEFDKALAASNNERTRVCLAIVIKRRSYVWYLPILPVLVHRRRTDD
jgi:hypothetical protein